MHRFHKDKLKKIFTSARQGGNDNRVPDLVVVSACHSEPVGNMFVEAGVSHVVAISRFKPVLDEAAPLDGAESRSRGARRA